MSSSATTGRRPASSSPSRRCRRSAAPTPGPLEVDGRDARRRPAPRSSRSPTTAISATARCSRSSSAHRQDASTGSYAETRARWEPLYEVTQIKGDGETHPFLSPNDEFANFERWDKGNLDLTEVKKPEMLEFEYARAGARRTVSSSRRSSGVNPYKFGMVGSTDAHTGLAAVEEDNFFGKTSVVEPKPGAPRTHVHDQPEDQRRRSWAGRRPPPATPPSGRPRTRARRSSTP